MDDDGMIVERCAISPEIFADLWRMWFEWLNQAKIKYPDKSADDLWDMYLENKDA